MDMEKINEYILEVTRNNLPFIERFSLWTQCIVAGILAGIIVPFYITLAVVFVMFLFQMPIWFFGALLLFGGTCAVLDRFYEFPELHMGTTKPKKVEKPKVEEKHFRWGNRPR